MSDDAIESLEWLQYYWPVIPKDDSISKRFKTIRAALKPKYVDDISQPNQLKHVPTKTVYSTAQAIKGTGNDKSRTLIRREMDDQGQEVVVLAAWYYEQLMDCVEAQPVPDSLVLVPSEYIDAMEELIEVAQLRGDQELPHPADDEKLWTARMQDAWGDAIYQVENLRTPPKQEGK